jgi:hypothetical protein
MTLKEFFFDITEAMLYFNKSYFDDLKNQNYYASNSMFEFYPTFLNKIMEDEMLVNFKYNVTKKFSYDNYLSSYIGYIYSNSSLYKKQDFRVVK